MDFVGEVHCLHHDELVMPMVIPLQHTNNRLTMQMIVCSLMIIFIHSALTMRMTHININQSWLSSRSQKLWSAYIESDIFHMTKLLIHERNMLLYLNNTHQIVQKWYRKRMSYTGENMYNMPIGHVQCTDIFSCYTSHKMNIIVNSHFSINLTVNIFHSQYYNYYHCAISEDTSEHFSILFTSKNDKSDPYCGNIMHPWSVLTNHHKLNIHSGGHRLKRFSATYQVMRKGQANSMFPKQNGYIMYINGIQCILQTKTNYIYHNLIQIDKIYLINIHINMTSFDGTILLHDGPGNQSPLLVQTSSNINVTCSTFQCYALFVQPFQNELTKDISASIIFSKIYSNKSTDIYIKNTDQNLKLLNNSNNLSIQDTYYVFTEKNGFVSVFISLIFLRTSSILDCVFGGIAILEDMNDGLKLRTNLCGSDVDISTPIQVTSTTNSLYISMYQYRPYSNIGAELQISQNPCKGVFLSPWHDPLIVQDYPIKVDIRSNENSFGLGSYRDQKVIEISFPFETCFFLQFWPIDIPEVIRTKYLFLIISTSYNGTRHPFIIEGKWIDNYVRHADEIIYNYELDNNNSVQQSVFSHDFHYQPSYFQYMNFEYFYMQSIVVQVYHIPCSVTCRSLNINKQDMCDICTKSYFNITNGYGYGYEYLQTISQLSIIGTQCTGNNSKIIIYEFLKHDYAAQISVTSKWKITPGQNMDIILNGSPTINFILPQMCSILGIYSYKDIAKEIISQSECDKIDNRIDYEYTFYCGNHTKDSLACTRVTRPVSWEVAHDICHQEASNLLNFHSLQELSYIMKCILPRYKQHGLQTFIAYPIPAVYIGIKFDSVSIIKHYIFDYAHIIYSLGRNSVYIRIIRLIRELQ